MGFLDFFRNVGSKIGGAAKHIFSAVKNGASVVKNGVGRVFGAGTKIADTVHNLYDKVTSIPVIGNLVRGGAEKLLSTPIPRLGVSLGTALKTAEGVTRAGNSLLNR